MSYDAAIAGRHAATAKREAEKRQAELEDLLKKVLENQADLAELILIGDAIGARQLVTNIRERSGVLGA